MKKTIILLLAGAVIAAGQQRSGSADLILHNGVTRLLASVIPKNFSRDRRLQQTKNALAEIRKFGVTNVSDMSDDLQLELGERRCALELTGPARRLPSTRSTRCLGSTLR